MTEPKPTYTLGANDVDLCYVEIEDSVSDDLLDSQLLTDWRAAGARLTAATPPFLTAIEAHTAARAIVAVIANADPLTFDYVHAANLLTGLLDDLAYYLPSRTDVLTNPSTA